MSSNKEIRVEDKSYAALFFILSGLLGFVTLWGFYNETITRRPWKEIQRQFYEYEYQKTKIELEKAKWDLPEIEAPQEIGPEQERSLKGAIAKLQIKLDEALQERKFDQSESDAVNYKYQHALHHGETEQSEKWKKKLDEFESRIEGSLTDAVLVAERNLADAYKDLAEFYDTHGHVDAALSEYLLVRKYNASDMAAAAKISELQTRIEAAKADKAKYAEVDRLEEKLHSVGGIKRTFIGTLAESPFTKTRTVVQYYIEDFDYTADRCATCHFASDKAGYDGFAKEQFEEIEGDGESLLTLQLKHPYIKTGSETVLIDEEDAEEDSYELSEDGKLTFADPDVYADLVEIAYETGYDPVLRTHPHRDVLLAKHPVERFGCTPCHGGQGQGLTQIAAHALDHKKEYWLTPVLGLDEHTGKASEELHGYMESNCRRCHDGVMMLDALNPETGELQDYSPALSKGMALFEDIGCHGCHAVEGYSVLADLDQVGPSLAKVGSKVNSVDWLEGWIKQPTAYLPETKMPDFFPVEKLTQAVYLKNGNKHYGVVTKTDTGIILQKDDGTKYPYPDTAVERVVDEVKSIAAYLSADEGPGDRSSRCLILDGTPRDCRR